MRSDFLFFFKDLFVVCCFSHSAHWLPTRKNLLALYTVANPARGLLNREKKNVNGQKWVYPPLFQTKVRGGKMQTSSPPAITPNRSQSNPDDMITLPRPIQSVGMDLHDVSGTSTGQTLPRERRAPPGTHFCPTIWWVYPHLLLFLSSTHYCPLFHPLLSEIYPLLTTLRPSKGGLKRQSLLQTWCGSAPRRGSSANGYDAWRFGSCGPGRKILAAASADPVWVCARPRTIRKWLRRLAFWILRTRAQDPCSCCLIFPRLYMDG